MFEASERARQGLRQGEPAEHPVQVPDDPEGPGRAGVGWLPSVPERREYPVPGAPPADGPHPRAGTSGARAATPKATDTSRSEGPHHTSRPDRSDLTGRGRRHPHPDGPRRTDRPTPSSRPRPTSLPLPSGAFPRPVRTGAPPRAKRASPGKGRNPRQRGGFPPPGAAGRARQDHTLRPRPTPPLRRGHRAAKGPLGRGQSLKTRFK